MRLSRADGSSSVDGQALLVAADGRVRADHDFVFFNAPHHPSGSVSVGALGSRALIEAECNLIERDVHRVVLCLSSDNSAASDSRFTAVVEQNGRTIIEFDDVWPRGIAALMVGELYRRNEGWKFRAIGQGWQSGLAGLASDFGVCIEPSDEVDTIPAAPVPQPGQPLSPPTTTTTPTQSTFEAGWYVDQNDPSVLRWWDAHRWTEHTRQCSTDPSHCNRCGQQLRSKRFTSGTRPCRFCEGQITEFLAGWRNRVGAALAEDGPRGERWSNLWLELKFERIPDSVGREAATAVSLQYLERQVAFAFADGEIEEDELSRFDGAVRDLSLPTSPQLSAMSQRMQRGRQLTQIRAGDLPRVLHAAIHLDTDEMLYLDAPAERIRYLQSGVRRDPGRLLVSNKKVRFVGPSAGTEMAWAKIVGSRVENTSVVVQATTARGGGTYAVSDAQYVSAVLEGALRRAKRLILAPGQRDSRSIPQHVKSEVWARDDGKCTQCGDRSYLEYDHVIPLSQGGATSIQNLQILCRRCNLEKGARI